MPAATPVFGLPYPLAGEPVDPAAFGNLAAAIDAALTSAAAERAALLAKPYLELTHFNAVSVASAVEQAVVWDAKGKDTSGMGPALGGTNITVVVPGVYVFQIRDAQISGYATIVDVLFSLFVNGIRTASEKKPATSFSGGQSPVTVVTLTYPLAAGDVVTVRWQFTGTGTTTGLYMNLSATLVCPLV